MSRLAGYVVAMVLSMVATDAGALSLREFVAKGRRVVAIAQAQGLGAAEKIYEDPRNGFLELNDAGLHVWATDAHGVVIFDLSGQTTPGTDLSHWTNEDGLVLMDVIGKTVTRPEGNLLAGFRGVPHPITNRIGVVDFWCGRLRNQALVCATFTPSAP